MRKKNLQYNVDGIPYVPVKFVEGVRDYLEYWVYNYDSGKLERQRRYISKKLSKRDREQQVREMSREINGLLHQGFTMGLKQEQDKILKTLEAFQKANKIKDGENGERANANYRSYLNILTLYLKEKKKDVLPITQFDREEMFLFLDWLNEERNVGPRTRNNYKDYVRTLFNTLMDRGVVQDNPASKIKDLATRSGRYIIFTASQKVQLEAYMKKHNYRLYLYTRFIYYAFMRPIEICRMRVRNIDLDKGIILVRNNQSKNKKQKPCVINPQLMEIIQKMDLDQYPEHYYIFGKDRMPSPTFRHRNRYSEDHRRILDACEIQDEGLDMYSWKHTGNCNAYLAGVDIYSLKIQNRHSSLRQTEIYLSTLGLRIPVELKTKKW